MNMMLRIASVLAFMLVLVTSAWAADPCPPELGQAKAALKKAQASFKTGPQAMKGQGIQAPRQMAGVKTQELQASRTQELQAPRAQELQAPRTQELQAPRTQELQAPRTQELQAPRNPAGAKSANEQQQRVNKASALIREGDAACKHGDLATATQKAKDALAVLK